MRFRDYILIKEFINSSYAYLSEETGEVDLHIIEAQAPITITIEGTPLPLRYGDQICVDTYTRACLTAIDMPVACLASYRYDVSSGEPHAI